MNKEIEYKWCYGCDETKPLTNKYWHYTDKTHTKFRNKCKKCTNYDSKISHRIHKEKGEQDGRKYRNIETTT